MNEQWKIFSLLASASSNPAASSGRTKVVGASHPVIDAPGCRKYKAPHNLEVCRSMAPSARRQNASQRAPVDFLYGARSRADHRPLFQPSEPAVMLRCRCNSYTLTAAEDVQTCRSAFEPPTLQAKGKATAASVRAADSQ